MTARARLHLVTAEELQLPEPQPPRSHARRDADYEPPEWMLEEGHQAFRDRRAARRYRFAILCVWAGTVALAALALKAAL